MEEPSRKTMVTAMDMVVLKKEADNHPYPLLFATLSGAHLYGFPSKDSDYDIRGAHIIPLAGVVGLVKEGDTFKKSKKKDGIDIDFVTHDVEKFCRLLLKKNGYVLEQLYSPLIIQTSRLHGELKEIVKGCITFHHARHYLGFARNQWNLFEKEEKKRVKPLLYVFRTLMTGIHLMRTGSVEANLLTLNDAFALPYISDLVKMKVEGREKTILDAGNLGFYEKEYVRLTGELTAAMGKSSLPERPEGAGELHQFLIRVRLKTVEKDR